jgi:hypothetical protein
MTDQNQITDENLIALIRRDCLRQARTAEKKLSEVILCLTDDNHLGALGAFINLDEDALCLKVFLSRIARLTVGGKKPIDQGLAQPKPNA